MGCRRILPHELLAALEESRLRLLIAQESFASPQEAVPSSLWARDRKMSAQSASASAARATAASEQQDRNGKEK